MVRKNELQTKMDQTIEKIQYINSELERYTHRLHEQEYRKPIFQQNTDSSIHALAQNLSERFIYFRIDIQHSAGKKRLFATPEFTPFKVDMDQYNLNKVLESAEKTLQDPSVMWPTFDTLVAYAGGFVAGLNVSASKIQELEHKLEAARGPQHIMLHPGWRY